MKLRPETATVESFEFARFDRFFSFQNVKARKATAYGYLNAILYLAPGRSAGVGNLCSHMTAACFKACLGEQAGRAGILPEGETTNSVRESRRRKARYFMRDRKRFLRDLFRHIARC